MRMRTRTGTRTRMWTWMRTSRLILKMIAMMMMVVDGRYNKMT